MPITINGDGAISGLGDIDGHDLETATLVVSGDTTLAPQAVGRASLFVDNSANTVGINTTTPNSSVFLEVADGTDPVVRVNNTGGGNLDIGSTTTAGYVRGSTGHELRLGSNGGDSIVLEGDGDVNIDNNTLFVDVSSNRVGIGNNAPGRTLHVNSTFFNPVRIQSSAVNSRIEFQDSGTSTFDSVSIGSDSDNFQINTNQIRRLTISSSGDLLIGTTGANNLGAVNSPYQAIYSAGGARLGLFGNGGRWWYAHGESANEFTIGCRVSGNTVDSNKVVIDSAGRVMIGTDNSVPSSTSVNSTLQVHSANGPAMFGRFANDSTASALYLIKSRSTIVGEQTIVNNGDNIGRIAFEASDGTQLRRAAIIDGFVDGTPGVADMPGSLVFSTTADNSSSPTQRMRINSNGTITLTGSSSNHSRFRLDGTNGITVTGARGFGNTESVPTTMTSYYIAFHSEPNLVDGGSFSELTHFKAQPQSTTASLTTQYGFWADANLTLATNNYGFYSNIDFATGRWNFYANGQASNYFAGEVLFLSNNRTGTDSGSVNGMKIGTDTVFRCSRTGSGNHSFFQFRRNSNSALVGSIVTDGTTTTYNTSSDYRLKENIAPITDAANRVKALKPCRFNFKADADKTLDGFIAHETQEVVPEAVIGKKDGEEMQAIDTSKLVPLLTAALQEALARIEVLESNQVN